MVCHTGYTVVVQSHLTARLHRVPPIRLTLLPDALQDKVVVVSKSLKDQPLVPRVVVPQDGPLTIKIDQLPKTDFPLLLSDATGDKQSEEKVQQHEPQRIWRSAAEVWNMPAATTLKWVDNPKKHGSGAHQRL